MAFVLYTEGKPDENFGWVILLIAFAALQHVYFGIKVGGARTKIGVAYPTMYVEAGKAYGVNKMGNPNPILTEEAAQEFNRYQRVHGNNLESLPNFYILAVLAGLAYPVPAAVFAGAWVLGRGLYAYGYYQGVAQRNWGSIHYAGSLGLIGLTIAFGIELLKKTAAYNS